MFELINFLSFKDKIKIYFIFFCIGISTILEFVSFGLFLPLINSFFESKNTIDPLKLGSFFPNFDFSEKFIINAFLIVFSFKVVLMIIINWYQTKSIWKIVESVTYKIYSIYIRIPYSRSIFKENSVRLRNLTTEVNQAILTFLNLSLFLIIDLLMVIVVLYFIFIVDYKIAILNLIIIFLVTFLFDFFTSKSLKRWGNTRQESVSKYLNVLKQSFDGLKEVKIFKLEKLFESELKKTFSLYSKVNSNNDFIGRISRNYLELISIILIGFSLYYFLQIDNPGDSIVIFGAYAYAGFRLLPTVNRIIASIAGIRYSRKSVDVIISEFKSEIEVQNKINKNYVEKFNVITLFETSFKYSNGADLVLENINLTINKNEIIGLIGESGCGKSTLIDLIMGILPITKGKLMIDNKINTNLDLNKIGYVPQKIYLFNNSIKKNIILEEEYDEETFNNILSITNLDEYINKLSEGINFIINENGSNLSGGQAQRIALARCLYKNPEIICLDEFTSALDQNTQNQILTTLNQLKNNRAIIIATHSNDVVSICDTVYKVENRSLKKLY